MAPDLPLLAADLGRHLMEDRLGILTAMIKAASSAPDLRTYSENC